MAVIYFHERGRRMDIDQAIVGSGAPEVYEQRKCGVCGGVLSIYNPNDYCFVHCLRGLKLESAMLENERYEIKREKERLRWQMRKRKMHEKMVR